MDPQASPPKRMTRARAAKVGESSTAAKTTKIVTASARARATRTTATASTKRKTRADEAEDEDDEADELAQPEPAPKARTRGRPKKIAEPEAEPQPEAPATRTRGRPKKTVEPSKEEAQPAKPATRTTRTKKTTQPDPEAPAEPAKKPTTRTRGTATAPTKSTAAKSATVKKSVKFEEPEKENIEPAPSKTTRGKAAAAAEPATTGLRAKPVRRSAVASSTTAARTSTRAGAAATKTSGQKPQYDNKPTPLSPKKITQMAMHNRAKNHLTDNNPPESEDELAADEKTPMKPRTKALSGARVRGGIRLQMPLTAAPKTQTSDENEAENEDVMQMPTITLGSPCRRPPPSPWKDSLKTPAKRVDGVPSLAQSAVRPPTRLFDSTTGETQQPQSAFKSTSLLQSPARRPQSAMKGLDLRPAGSLQLGAPSPFKSSLFSPPKRGLTTPGKGSFMGFGSPMKQQEQQEDETVFGRTPAPKPTLLATPLATEDAARDEEQRHCGEVEIPEDVQEEEIEPNRLLFPGRMSAVLPRHAHPALDQESETEDEQIEEHLADRHERDQNEELVSTEDHQQFGELSDDAMHIDEPEEGMGGVMSQSEREATTTPPASPPQQQQQQGAFGLRDKDLDPHYHDQDTESEDEDELATPSRHIVGLPATPCPPTSRSTNMTVRPANFGERSTAKRARTDDNKFGFTPLVGKLGAWNAGSSPVKSSPLKMGMGRPESPDVLSLDENQTAEIKSPIPVASPMRNNFFDEAMSGQTAPEAEISLNEQVDDHHVEEYSTEQHDVEVHHVEEHVPESMQTEEDDGVLTPEFDDMPITQEDISLAAEAYEMSLMEPAQVEDLLQHDDALSEASQEYGDENAIPIDPTLMVPPVTPQRNVTGLREFHTVSKVPLKPADDSTPRPKVKRRGHSISRLPVQRPNQGLQRNATVISNSTTKQSTQIENVETEERRESAPPTTPAKSEWSTAGTPARTLRRDLDPALLRGAVVFVDVHTSDGADASGIFVELLAQMGARCVKTWSWNPSSPPQDSAQQSKVGITHVVYKDGGKRTLEKVRESNGVVQCVGVSWVLDCERENTWLDEAPYYINTTLAPRGGARRRKSMEPKALANLDGQVVIKTPSSKPASSARDCQSLPPTPLQPSSFRRRDSCLWMRTPPEQLHLSPEDLDEAAATSDWDENNNSFLTPVPKTPAPEQVARYAAAVALEATPTGMDMTDSENGDTDEHGRMEMMTRTCPPKSSSVYHELGEGVLKREKDEGVLMRLMAARRKSLQFAPKVGSPLARAWQ
ncbi:hypothetical protein GE09DRAFT_1068264 [Coniochaeta sp. 2T2.1]|nr:hypothetical protein GE09DRAFT_1068264 [Coniochaeta sp. 2T2.1]